MCPLLPGLIHLFFVLNIFNTIYPMKSSNLLLLAYQGSLAAALPSTSVVTNLTGSVITKTVYETTSIYSLSAALARFHAPVLEAIVQGFHVVAPETQPLRSWISSLKSDSSLSTPFPTSRPPHPHITQARTLFQDPDKAMIANFETSATALETASETFSLYLTKPSGYNFSAYDFNPNATGYLAIDMNGTELDIPFPVPVALPFCLKLAEMFRNMSSTSTFESPHIAISTNILKSTTPALESTKVTKPTDAPEPTNPLQSPSDPKNTSTPKSTQGKYSHTLECTNMPGPTSAVENTDAQDTTDILAPTDVPASTSTRRSKSRKPKATQPYTVITYTPITKTPKPTGSWNSRPYTVTITEIEHPVFTPSRKSLETLLLDSTTPTPDSTTEATSTAHLTFRSTFSAEEPISVCQHPSFPVDLRKTPTAQDPRSGCRTVTSVSSSASANAAIPRIMRVWTWSWSQQRQRDVEIETEKALKGGDENKVPQEEVEKGGEGVSTSIPPISNPLPSPPSPSHTDSFPSEDTPVRAPDYAALKTGYSRGHIAMSMKCWNSSPSTSISTSNPSASNQRDTNRHGESDQHSGASEYLK